MGFGGTVSQILLMGPPQVESMSRRATGLCKRRGALLLSAHRRAQYEKWSTVAGYMEGVKTCVFLPDIW